MRFSKYLYLVLPLVFAIVAAISVYFFLEHYLVNRAKQEVEDILLSNRGFHQYVQRVLHPAIFQDIDSGLISRDFYDPQIMSSTYIVRTLHGFNNEERAKHGLQSMYYKMAALNPRNPVNKADGWEAAKIVLFRRDSTIHEQEEVVTVDKKKYLYYAVPFLRNEQRCLRCHGNPADAPPGLKRMYPLEGGYHEKVGELRAIESLRIPLGSESLSASVLAVFSGVGLFSIIALFIFNGSLRSNMRSKTISLEKEVGERISAVEDLRESEEKFKNVFENSAIGKSITYLDGSINANTAFYRMLGYTKDELTQHKWQNITHPDDIELSQKNLEELISGRKQTVRFTKRYFKKDGSIVWADVNVVLQTDRNGKPFYYITGIIDITDKVLATEALTAEKERLAVTLRSIGDAVIATDVTGYIVLMNRVAENLTGWPFTEAAGKSLPEVFCIIDEKTRLLMDNPAEKVLLSGEIIDLANHTILVARDGTERVIADSGAPIQDRDGKTIGVVLVFRDMTEKQKLTETLQRTAKLESIGVLAGGIAHDFNNLMGGIYGYIDMTIDETDMKMVAKNLLKAMETIDRARGLTQQLLTFAKGGAPVQKPTPLLPFIKETAQFALSGSSVACRFDIPDNLWLCNIDKNQICQVIDNIMINAQQAMPAGGVVDFSARNVSLPEKNHPTLSAGNYVKIAIRDYGIGISKEYLSRIFDPFFTTKSKGHGLGLATSHSIINRHGGAIDVESTPEKGSTFFIYLPAATESGSDAPSMLNPKHTGSGTIVVMDDEEVMRQTISKMLEVAGYSVICKSEGSETLDYIRQAMNASHSITALILDLTIPGGMGGKEVVNEIRKSDAKIPVFVASGYADDPVMKNPSDYGFTASICKPFRKSELWEMLNAHLHMQ